MLLHCGLLDGRRLVRIVTFWHAPAALSVGPHRREPHTPQTRDTTCCGVLLQVSSSRLAQTFTPCCANTIDQAVLAAQEAGKHGHTVRGIRSHRQFMRCTLTSHYSVESAAWVRFYP
jgi:hypothetical protein